MINPTEEIGIVTIGHTTQISYKLYEHCNTDSDVILVTTKEMYIHKYAVKKYQFSLNPFKVVML